MTTLTHAELAAAVAANAQPTRQGTIVPVSEKNRVEQSISALAVREAGGIPLVIDERWDDALGAALRRVAAGQPHPTMAWASATSGSTGAPRILLRTARSWAVSFPVVSELLELTMSDVMYLPSPASSSLTLFSLAHAFTDRFTLALATRRSTQADELADATIFHGTPSALRTIIDADAGRRLRAALVGGAPLDTALRRRAEDRGIRVVAYYGAAELSFVAVDDTGDGLRPFPGVEIETRDGELWVRSPTIASAILSSAPLSSGPLPSGRPGPGHAGPGHAGSALRRDDNGWATVGDRASFSEGHIVLRGRSDDAILTAAATVIPAEVEAALRDIDGVLDAVVIGTPSSPVGALVTAVIEPDATHPLPSYAQLRAGAATRLTPTHVPRRWFVVDELPRTPSGKPARAEIAHRVLSGEVPTVV